MQIFNILVQICITGCIFLIPIGIILGIVFLVKAIGDNDSHHKARNFWIMGISFVSPIVLLFILLSVWGLVSILTNTAKP